MKTIWSLVIISSLLLGYSSFAQAMGNKPKEPEYKLEIIKMELVPAVGSFEIKAATTHTVLLVIPPRSFRDGEMTRLKALLEKNAVKVVIGSTSLKPAYGYSGKKVQPTVIASAAKTGDYSAVVFLESRSGVTAGGQVISGSEATFGQAILKALKK
jgi:hypothetical protein